MGDVDFERLNIFLKPLGLRVEDDDENRQISDQDRIHGEGLNTFFFTSSDYYRPLQLNQVDNLKKLVQSFVPFATTLWKESYSSNTIERHLTVLGVLRERMETTETKSTSRSRNETTMIYWATMKKMKLPYGELKREIGFFEEMVKKHQGKQKREHEEIVTNAKFTIAVLQQEITQLKKR